MTNVGGIVNLQHGIALLWFWQSFLISEFIRGKSLYAESGRRSHCSRRWRSARQPRSRGVWRFPSGSRRKTSSRVERISRPPDEQLCGVSRPARSLALCRRKADYRAESCQRFGTDGGADEGDI